MVGNLLCTRICATLGCSCHIAVHFAGIRNEDMRAPADKPP